MGAAYNGVRTIILIIRTFAADSDPFCTFFHFNGLHYGEHRKKKKFNFLSVKGAQELEFSSHGFFFFYAIKPTLLVGE